MKAMRADIEPHLSEGSADPYLNPNSVPQGRQFDTALYMMKLAQNTKSTFSLDTPICNKKAYRFCSLDTTLRCSARTSHIKPYRKAVPDMERTCRAT